MPNQDNDLELQPEPQEEPEEATVAPKDPTEKPAENLNPEMIVLDESQYTTDMELQPEQEPTEGDSEDEEQSSGTAQDMPAIAVLHPMLGHPGTPDSIPDNHDMWLGANLTIAMRDKPLTVGPNNFIISGNTPEAIADRLRDIMVEALTDMREKSGIIQRATPDQVPPERGENRSKGGIVLP